MESISTTEDALFVTLLVLPAQTHKLALLAQPTHTSKESSVSLIVELDNSLTTRQDHATHALQLVPLASEPPLPHALPAQQVNSSTRTNV